MKRKPNLQRHRMQAFSQTLSALELSLIQKLQFIEDYNSVYRFPSSIYRRNSRRLRKWIKAVQKLKEIQHHHL